MDIHADKTRVRQGEPVTLNLSVVNDINKGALTVQLIVKTPSGWTWKSGISDNCTGLCSITDVVPTGLRRRIEVTITPNQTGEFIVPATLKWSYPNEKPEQKDLSIPVAVFDLSDPPTAIAAAGTISASEPTPTPLVESGGGCDLPSGEGGPLDASLVLLGLFVPLVAIRKHVTPLREYLPLPAIWRLIW